MCGRHRFFSAFALFSIGFWSVVLLLPTHTCAQGLELNGGWAHVTGDFGTDGFDVGAAYYFGRRVSLAANYDSSWDTSTLSNFSLTQIGTITTKSHLQSFLIGPRIFFSSGWTDKHKLNPFGEAQFGVSHLNQTISQVNIPSVSASDNAFSWMLGGGAEYLLTPHWSGRANLDFLRTHLANQGQSRLRLVLGIAYTFGERERKETHASAAAQSATQHPSESSQLMDLEHTWAEALQKGDTARLDSILDTTYVDVDETGHRTDKYGVIASLTSGDLKISSLKLSGLQVYDHGTSATVTGRAAQEGTFKNQPLADSVVFTDSFVKKDGMWKVVASHRSISHE